jgi:Na+/H+ antiporter NhaA
MLFGLAIAGDIGAIIVIAVIHTDQIHAGWLLGAVAGVVLIIAMRHARIRYTPDRPVQRLRRRRP